jgi:4Fe-4S ferredoxin
LKKQRHFLPLKKEDNISFNQIEKRVEEKKMRGKIEKTETKLRSKLERRLLSTYYLLELNKDLCNACSVCIEVCPKEAIELKPPIIEKNTLVKKPQISFDISKCILCGECATLCPLNAMTMKINDNKVSMIKKNEAFPNIIKGIQVKKKNLKQINSDFSSNQSNQISEIKAGNCFSDCDMICEKECPTSAIKVDFHKKSNGKLSIVDVDIDESLCFYCKRCEIACPYDVIKVQKPFHGKIEIDTSLCPKNCTICQDICSPKAITRKKGELVISEEFCVFCSACEKVCPEKAIMFQRDKINHTEIKSAAWLTALKKLTSFETMRKEVMVKASSRRKSAVEGRKKHIIC